VRPGAEEGQDTSGEIRRGWPIIVSVGAGFCLADGEPSLKRAPPDGGVAQTLFHSCSFNSYQVVADDSNVTFTDRADDPNRWGGA
jgi:hypothetical protein